MDEPYKKRELDTKFESVHEKLDDIKTFLGSILEQTKKTNGRVNDLEVRNGSISGGLKVLYGVLIVLVMPLFWYMFNQLNTLSQKVVQYPYGVSSSQVNTQVK